MKTALALFLLVPAILSFEIPFEKEIRPAPAQVVIVPVNNIDFEIPLPEDVIDLIETIIVVERALPSPVPVETKQVWGCTDWIDSQVGGSYKRCEGK